MFTWMPIYKELAEKLMTYRNRQSELLEILHRMNRDGIPVISLKDVAKNEKEIDLAVMDPFTFFANFNRGITVQNRRAILQELKTQFQLVAPVPDDFHGIPIANLQKSWFFPYAHIRDKADIPSLWDLAESCMTSAPDSLDASLFERCLEIMQVGVAKLTMGLFWLNPRDYIAMDGLMTDYLTEKGIKVQSTKIDTLADYTQIVKTVRDKMGSDFPEISRDAYLIANTLQLDPKAVDHGFQSVLSEMAKFNGMTVEEVVDQLAYTKKENEISNRIRVYPLIRSVLSSVPKDIQALRKVCSELWVLGNSQDAIRRNAFLDSERAADAIGDLLDDSTGIEESDRIDRFVTDAVANGYASPKGPDVAGALQFASILMSAVKPERYVDYRVSRWNRLYSLITNGKESIRWGTSSGMKLTKAGALANALTATPTFKTHFGSGYGTWKVAGLAWYFGKGMFKLQKEEIVAINPHTPPVQSLNIILYGPPGTGKTWTLRNDYMRRFTESAATMTIDDLTTELVSDLAWWEVITMVMLELKSGKVSAIMAHPLMKARIQRANNRTPRAAIWAHIQMHTKTECEEVKYTKRYEPLLFSKDATSVWSIDSKLAHEEVPELVEKLNRYRTFKPGQGADIKRYVFTTFHQSYSYEDFVEGIKPVMGEEVTETLAYEIKPGVFKAMAQRAIADPDHEFAIIIDEINRGNIANIFGELIALIEDDKRKDMPNELRATLPYSREEFVVPKNLFIIGAMNTADRSVEALDTALRRRFTFLSVPPQPEKIPQSTGLKVDLQHLLRTINARIEKIFDKDHCIGHSYFMGIAASSDPLTELRRAFATKILPLLEEYFYGDPAKIGMVLGDRFVTRNGESVSWAKGDWGLDEFEERHVYTISDPMRLTEEDFRSVYDHE